MKKCFMSLLFLTILVDLSGCSTVKEEPSQINAIDWVIATQYQYASSFSAGAAVVQDSDGIYFFVDKSNSNIFGKRLKSVDIPRNAKDFFRYGFPTVVEEGNNHSYDIARIGFPAKPLDYPITNQEIGRNVLMWAMSDNNLVGLVNWQNQWVVPPTYQYLHTTAEWPIRASTENAYGILSDDLEFIEVSNVYHIDWYQDGMALAYLSDEDNFRLTQYNFLDSSGSLAFQKNFLEDAPRYSNGIVAYKENGLWGYVNIEGRVLITPKYQEAGVFSEGLAAVTNDDGEIAYIDLQGNVKISYRKGYYGGSFQNGMATFSIQGSDGNVAEGVIDGNGNWIVKPQYDSCFYYAKENVWELKKDESADVFFPDSNRFAYDLGTVLVTAKNSIVSTKNDKSIITSFENNEVQTRSFELLGDFAEGLAPAATQGRYGYVDTKGHWRIAPQFEMARPFSEGVAAVETEGKWGYIANPLIYDKWHADEAARARALAFIQEGGIQQNDAPISSEEFCQILNRVLEKRGYASRIQSDGDMTTLTRQKAAVLLAELAQKIDQYYPYYILQLQDNESIDVEAKHEVAFAASYGLIDLQNSSSFNPQKEISRKEAYHMALRMFECSLDGSESRWPMS